MYKFIILLSLIQFSLFGQNAEWQTFASVDGNFEVAVPGGLMAYNNMMVETAIGEIKYDVYFLEQEETAENWLYMISYCDYPEGAIHSDSTDLLTDFFDQTAKVAAESVQGELLYGSSFSWRDYPGYQFRIDFGKKDKSVVRTKSILVGNRYYSIQVFCFEGMSLNPSISKFMDSFTLLSDQ